MKRPEDVTKAMANPITSYVDSDWAACRKDRKSRSGNLQLLWGMYNDSFVRDQSSIAMSSTESELNGVWMSSASQVWLRHLLGEIGFAPVKAGVTYSTNKTNEGKDLFDPKQIDLGPSTVWCDNTGAVAAGTSGVFNRGLRHVDLKLHKVAEYVKGDVIQLKWISTDDMLADIFTKPLPVPKFEDFRDRIMGGRGEQEFFVHKREGAKRSRMKSHCVNAFMVRVDPMSADMTSFLVVAQTDAVANAPAAVAQAPAAVAQASTALVQVLGDLAEAGAPKAGASAAAEMHVDPPVPTSSSEVVPAGERNVPIVPSLAKFVPKMPSLAEVKGMEVRDDAKVPSYLCPKETWLRDVCRTKMDEKILSIVEEVKKEHRLSSPMSVSIPQGPVFRRRLHPSAIRRRFHGELGPEWSGVVSYSQEYLYAAEFTQESVGPAGELDEVDTMFYRDLSGDLEWKYHVLMMDYDGIKNRVQQWFDDMGEGVWNIVEPLFPTIDYVRKNITWYVTEPAQATVCLGIGWDDDKKTVSGDLLKGVINSLISQHENLFESLDAATSNILKGIQNCGKLLEENQRIYQNQLSVAHTDLRLLRKSVGGLIAEGVSAVVGCPATPIQRLKEMLSEMTTKGKKPMAEAVAESLSEVERIDLIDGDDQPILRKKKRRSKEGTEVRRPKKKKKRAASPTSEKETLSEGSEHEVDRIVKVYLNADHQLVWDVKWVGVKHRDSSENRLLRSQIYADEVIKEYAESEGFASDCRKLKKQGYAWDPTCLDFTSVGKEELSSRKKGKCHEDFIFDPEQRERIIERLESMYEVSEEKSGEWFSLTKEDTVGYMSVEGIIKKWTKISKFMNGRIHTRKCTKARQITDMVGLSKQGRDMMGPDSRCRGQLEFCQECAP